MKILVTGSKGQLGTDVSALLKKQNIEVIGADLPETDITDISAVRAAVESASPDAVIHLAAYTAVDKAESEKELCTAVNVKGTENVARAEMNPEGSRLGFGDHLLAVEFGKSIALRRPQVSLREYRFVQFHGVSPP